MSARHCKEAELERGLEALVWRRGCVQGSGFVFGYRGSVGVMDALRAYIYWNLRVQFCFLSVSAASSGLLDWELVLMVLSIFNMGAKYHSLPNSGAAARYAANDKRLVTYRLKYSVLYFFIPLNQHLLCSLLSQHNCNDGCNNVDLCSVPIFKRNSFL